MPTRALLGGLLTLASASALLTPVAAEPASGAAGVASGAGTAPRGTVVKARPLDEKLWIPGSRKAFELKYVTSNTFGEKSLSTGSRTPGSGCCRR